MGPLAPTRCTPRLALAVLITPLLMFLVGACSTQGSAMTPTGAATPGGVGNKAGLVQPQDGPWLMASHDSLHTGRVDAPAIKAPRVMWSKQLGERILAGAAIGEDGTVYVAAEGERFEATGHALYALTPQGEVKWKLEVPAPVRTTPLVDNGSLFFGAYDGTFRSTTLDGGVRWLSEPEDISNRISLSSPAMALDGTIYFGEHGGAVRAISSAGERLWSFPSDEDIRAAPAIAQDGTVYVGSNDGIFYALNPDGALKWSFETGGRIDSPATIAPDGTVYFGSSDGKVYALTPDGLEKWSVAVGRGLSVVTSPALGLDATIYVGTTGTAPLGADASQDAAAYYFIALTPEGETKWRFPLTRWARSSPAVVGDGTIYFGGWDGDLYALWPDGTQRWRLPLGDSPLGQAIEASLAVAADGTIYVGTWDGRFLAIGETD